MKKLTIVIPCFNEEKSIKPLIKMIDEFRKDINFIIVENGSTDNSKAILQNIKKPDNLLFLYKKNNTGYGAGIKFGLEKTRSEFVGWMHADLQQNINVLDDAINILNKFVRKDSKNNYCVKGLRTNRKFFDLIFTWCMAFFTSLLFCGSHWRPFPTRFLVYKLKKRCIGS